MNKQTSKQVIARNGYQTKFGRTKQSTNIEGLFRGVCNTHKDKNAGYVLLITLLMLVALTIAGMGAMMVATTDISQSGNQRQQLLVSQPPGIDMGMANLCSSYYYNTNPSPTVNTGVLNTPPSMPNAGFYSGIYSTPVPSTNAGTNYNVAYMTMTSLPFPAPPTPFGAGWSKDATGQLNLHGGGGGGNFYRVISMGVGPNKVKMECEQIMYYGIP